MPVTAVLFDLDNTLLDRQRSLDLLAQRFVGAFSDRLVAPAAEDVRAVFREADDNGYRPKSEALPRIISALSWSRKPSIDELKQFWRQEFPECAQPMDGVPQVLGDLRQRGVKLGIVTNGPSGHQERKIAVLGLDPYIQVVVVSGTAGVAKPDRRIFRIALNSLNDRAAQTMFVGDNPVSDIVGARDAGLIPVWLRGHIDWPEEYERPAYVVDRLGNVADVLEAVDR